MTKPLTDNSLPEYLLRQIEKYADCRDISQDVAIKQLIELGFSHWSLTEREYND